jgi:chromosome segregation ATPase
MKTFIYIIALVIGVSAQAKTDVSGSLDQIKQNEENSKFNKKQYSDNVEIASKNIAEVSAAIKQLREQKAQLISNAQNLEKNRAIVDKMKEKLAEHSKDEAAALKKEETQIAQLKATLDKLEANKKQREENIAAYSQKIDDVNKEKADWDSQKQAFQAIQKELDSKESTATQEREKWMAKRKGYQDETTKWEKESEIAEQNRIKFQRLNN